jgi:hypothetical protein
LAPAALAAAGLARIALPGGDLQRADFQSGRAVKMLDAVRMEYDVRNRIEIWGARAETLLAMDQIVPARAWAAKAASAADRYCAPGTKYPVRENRLLDRIAATEGKK